uniref:Endonuclease-reverse transcriptase n=1 Tax=Macrostomum lignano TaxID=282301 RepID=A0A1I8GQ52_9PLAT
VNSIRKERSEKEKSCTQDKEDRKARFLARLKQKINSIKNEQLVIKTRFSEAKNLCMGPVQADVDGKRLQFNTLEMFIAEIETLSCLARKKQAEVLAELKNQLGVSTEVAAKRLDIGIKFAERLFTFHNLMRKYPNLALTGYSMETLLAFKKTIEKEADQDDNFCSKL